MLVYCHLLSLLITVAGIDAAQYRGINGLHCMRTEFVETHTDVQSKVECASLCDLILNCQAFSVADGPCLLFVFHRCSKYVRDCSCSRRVQMFVKQQSGLPPGAMCPVGFTDDLCGTKYKFYGGITDWNVAKTTIDAEPGLTIMADVTDDTELTHMNAVFSRDSLTKVILGGHQQPGSPEPSGDWYWASCNSNINSSLWSPGQPNNFGGNEEITVGGTFVAGLNDAPQLPTNAVGALGECVSPFE